MKKTIKNTAILAVASTSLLSTGCKKYEEGPGLSLKTKKARLVGDWDLKETDNERTQEFLKTNGEIIFEFEKDGDVNVSTEGILNYSYGGWYGYSYSYSRDVDNNELGSWEFNDDKSDVEITYGGNYTNSFEIIRLTNKELILEDENNKRWDFEKMKD